LDSDYFFCLSSYRLVLLCPLLENPFAVKLNGNTRKKTNMNKKLFPLLLATTLVGSMLTGCATIPPGGVGVKVALGNMDKNLMKPGFYLFPQFNPLTDDIIQYTVKQHTVGGKATPLTSDQQPIEVSYNVLYRLPESNILRLYSQYSGDPYETLVAPQIQEAFRQVVSQYKADYATKNLTQIKNQVLGLVQENTHGLVVINDIPITHVELPPVIKEAIQRKQVAEQEALQKAYELDKARRQAQITVANAEAQAKSIQLQSEALAKHPQLIEYEKAKKWNGVLPTTVISGGGQNTLFQIK
jgi:prohibitin 2